MESSSVYDTFLVRFKKDLWSKCVEFKVFDFISEEYIGKTKSVFENIVANYQSQILQHEDKENTNILYEKLINEISKEVAPFKNITRDNIQSQKQNLFDRELEEKQKEFNTMMNKDVPPTPHFSDDHDDKPIEQENLDKLIKIQMKEREKVMNINEDNNNLQNVIVSENNTCITDNVNEQTNTSNILNSPMTVPSVSTNQNIEILQKLEKIEERILIQFTILKQIVESQLTILRKIK